MSGKEEGEGNQINKQAKSRAQKIVASSKLIPQHAIYSYLSFLFFSIPCFVSFLLPFRIAIQYQRNFYRHQFNNRHTHIAYRISSSLCATMIPIVIHLLRTMKKLICSMNWVSNSNNKSQERKW